MREFINLMLLNEEYHLMNFWEAAAALDCDVDYHDATLGWINRNSPGCIYEAIRDPAVVLQSKLRFYTRHLLRKTDYGTQSIDLDLFKAALSRPITLWRGGRGTYDPAMPRRSWVSYTGDRSRAKTFSYYNGTIATKAWMLPRNDKWWVVELTLPLDDILLYLSHGTDEEVIVPRKISKKAKVIATHETHPEWLN